MNNFYFTVYMLLTGFELRAIVIHSLSLSLSLSLKFFIVVTGHAHIHITYIHTYILSYQSKNGCNTKLILT